jgi:redox-sensitive bicupin YhaK (pirin superfamily)
MIRVIPSSQRHFADHGWLQTHWHFSFSDYYDPKNLHWSSLRVFNDDIVQPGGGFPMHPHENMEIVTYVVSGELEHQDRLGNRGIIRPGEVQVMSAGKGIVHSEYNPSEKTPVHLLQLWLLPRQKDKPPRWEQRRFSTEERTGVLLPVVSSGEKPNTLAIDQDATIFVSRLKAGQSVAHKPQPKRHAYLFVISGDLELNGRAMAAGDQARIVDEANLQLTATQDAEIILLDLP